MSAQLISIYVSSPSDVVDERGVVQQVVDRLQHDPLLPGPTHLRQITWDHPAGPVPTPQSEPPQAAINTMQARPSECDVFIAVLWSRLGTPIPSLGGRSYPSGTAWEIDDALAGAGRPVVLIYHRTCAPALPLDDDWRARGEQFEAVQAYLSDLQARLAGGGLGSVFEYRTLDEFRQTLDSHLRHLVKRQRVGSHRRPMAPATARRSRSPYPGLLAYTPADADVFFGRDREVDELVGRVRRSPFTAVVGASGSGKSSVVAAGLLPRLAATSGAGGRRWRLPRYDGDREVWEGPRITPAAGGGAPARALALALDSTAAPHESSSVLCRQLCRAAAPERSVIVVDQFEEVFGVVSSGARDEFLDLLVALADEDLATIVVSLRADFLGSALQHEGLARHLLGALVLGPPGYAATREMIEEPARISSLEFDAELAGTLLTDARKEPGRLPLLAFTLSELYRHRDGNQLTMDAYRAIGGVEKAIGSLAEQTFKQLDPPVQREFAAIFRRLLDIDPVGGPVRSGVPRDALADTRPRRALVDALIAARLLVAEREPTGETIVEVAHEALFSGWPRLAELIDSAHEDMLAAGRMRREAAAWRITRDPFLLWRQEQIDSVLRALRRLGVEPTPAERRFLLPEADRLVEELQEDGTTHHRRREISSRLAALGDPRPGVGVIAGYPWIEWCRVPPGGDDDAFWIGKYPVTIAQLDAYRRSSFVSDTETLTALEDVQPNLPAACSWIEAAGFCQWLARRATARPEAAPPSHTVRLPTVVEWRLAASRDRDLAYPWGAEWDERCANAASSDLGQPIAVGMYPSGRAWTEALDLSGGVWEWCEDAQAGSEGGLYVLKGGSAMEPPARCRLDGMRTMRGDVVRVDRGFRVCCGPLLRQEPDVPRR